MIAKGCIVIKNDKKVATFNSVFKDGDMYELRYNIQFYTPLLERD